jgi:ATP-dependent Lon protease
LRSPVKPDDDDPDDTWVSPVATCVSSVRTEAKKKNHDSEGNDNKKYVESRWSDLCTTLPPAGAQKVRRALKESEEAKSDETTLLKRWLDHVERVPWNKTSPPLVESRDNDTGKRSEVLDRARGQLDAFAHGMTNAKEAIVMLIGKMLRAPDAPVRALGIQGPPGCGKTMFASRAIAAGMKRPSYVINVGGARDACLLVGHEYTYKAARPGRVFDALAHTGVRDPVLVIDEVDKVNGDQGRDIVHRLMALVDPVQNRCFVDDYLSADLPIDMSRAFLVFTFNDASQVDPILLDRINVISMPAPSKKDKLTIARDYILKRISKEYGG